MFGYVQDWDGDGHDGDCGLRQSPDREVDAFVREVGVSHVDDHYGLDDASDSSAVGS